MKIRAVLDTSSLLGPFRHRLVYCAFKGAYRIVWSSFLIAELVRIRTEWGIRQGIPRRVYRGNINKLIDDLSRISMFAKYTNLQGGNYEDWLHDPDDWPLLATALAGHARYIVSENTRDFPPNGVFAGVSYMTPDAFLEIIYERHPRLKRTGDAEELYRLP